MPQSQSGSIEIRAAVASDELTIRSLLASASLPTSDLAVGTKQDFLVAVNANAVVGCVALERCGTDGLLRSLAVREDLRGRGLGKQLFHRMMLMAGGRGVKVLYLLTTTAERFFSNLGFVSIARASVPAAVSACAEFRSICPSSAACMTRRIDRVARKYPAEALRLRPDVPGAEMWSVALDKAMMTYFVIEPQSRFERHTHESEQITFVVEGELIFELEGGERTTIREGEVIAIPSNVPHAVATGEKRARAVDAWSPVRPDYS